MPTPRLRLGQLLVDARLISAAALDEVLAAQRTDGRRLGTLLVEKGLINETQLTQILSHQLSVPWVSLLHIEFSRQLLNLVPREVADRFCVVPIYVRHVRNQGDTLYVAMDDPSNEEGLRACREHAGLPVRAMIAPPADIRSAIRVYYGVAPAVAVTSPVAAPPVAAPPVTAAQEPAAAAPPAPKAEPAIAPVGVDAPATQREPGMRPAAEAARVEEVTSSAGAPAPAAPPAPPPDVAQASAVPTPRHEETSVTPGPEEAPPPTRHEAAADGPTIETVEISVDHERAERLRGLLDPSPTPPPPSAPEVENIPRPRGRAPRMVALTLLDGTTITLPAKRRARERRPVAAFDAPDASPAEGEPPAPQPPTMTSEPPAPDDAVQGLTARDLVLALRVVANGADASEVLGSNIRWESLFSALLSLLLKKHLIADWEFIDELKKQL